MYKVWLLLSYSLKELFFISSNCWLCFNAFALLLRENVEYSDYGSQITSHSFNASYNSKSRNCSELFSSNVLITCYSPFGSEIIRGYLAFTPVKLGNEFLDYILKIEQEGRWVPKAMEKNIFGERDRESPRLSDILHKTGADSQRWILILAVD